MKLENIKYNVILKIFSGQKIGFFLETFFMFFWVG
jgi:hypothetical protein